jgi:hypothetical protein
MAQSSKPIVPARDWNFKMIRHPITIDDNTKATTTNIRMLKEISRTGTSQMIDVIFRALSASFVEHEE